MFCILLFLFFNAFTTSEMNFSKDVTFTILRKIIVYSRKQKRYISSCNFETFNECNRQIIKIKTALV